MNYGKHSALPILTAILLAIASPALYAVPKAAEHKDAEVVMSNPETQAVAPKPTKANVQKSTRTDSKAKKPNKSPPVQKKARTTKRK